MNSKHSSNLMPFNEALEIAALEARAAHLDKACGAGSPMKTPERIGVKISKNL